MFGRDVFHFQCTYDYIRFPYTYNYISCNTKMTRNARSKKLVLILDSLQLFFITEENGI